MSNLIAFMPRRIEIVNKIDEKIDKESQEIFKDYYIEGRCIKGKAIKALIMRP